MYGLEYNVKLIAEHKSDLRSIYIWHITYGQFLEYVKELMAFSDMEKERQDEWLAKNKKGNV